MTGRPDTLENQSPLNDALQTYRQNYPEKEMNPRIAPEAHHMIQMERVSGWSDLSGAPANQFITISSLPNDEETAKAGRHLWVIRANDVPTALEYRPWGDDRALCPWGDTSDDDIIKHSNLTGGAPAHSGGEIWFCSGTKIIVNAYSGRYGASSREEFELIIEALIQCGFEVAFMGFDAENSEVPNSILLGEPEWRKKSD